MQDKIELLAPAGDFSKLKLALLYGADAVYVGGKDFGMRAKAGNFTDEELKQATEFVHASGKKIYVTVNIFARNTDFGPLKTYLKFLDIIKVDAVIVSDLGVLRLAKEITSLEVHISTQANVLNKYTAEEYVKLGASRIILARECSLAEIKEIAAHLNNSPLRKRGGGKAAGVCDIEVFIHGAMCVSYSGRCLLSAYLNGADRDANRGACIQACRFKYKVKYPVAPSAPPLFLKGEFFVEEEKRPGQAFQIEEDSRGSYILNSRDLCLADHLKNLAAAGVKSFKIEGRTKSEYYAAGVVNTYRKLIDQIFPFETKGWTPKADGVFDYKKELEKISHRPYTTGFLFDEASQNYETSAPIATHEFVAIVISNTPSLAQRVPPRYNTLEFCNVVTRLYSEGTYPVEQRNAFSVGDTLEILSPNPETFNKTFTVTGITNSQSEQITRAKLVQEVLKIECPFELREGDILRRKV